MDKVALGFLFLLLVIICSTLVHHMGSVVT